jgi:cytochrome c oxidase cbb3-type subunit 1
MWVAGIGEGLMWRAYTELGFLEYAFIETVSEKHISYMVRALGGTLFLLGTFIMSFNLYMTIKGKGMAESLEGDVPLTRKPVIPEAAPVAAGE